MTGNQIIVVRLSQDGKFYEAFIRDNAGHQYREPPGVTLLSRSATASTVGTAVANELSGFIMSGGT